MIVRQVGNALDLFEYFARRKQPATLTEIANEFNWPRSSTFNIIETLLQRGFLYEPRPAGYYYPTPRWSIVAQEILDAEPPLPASAEKLLRKLMRSSGETLYIAGAAGTSAVILAVAESEAPVRYSAFVGKRLPIHATATGRALLAQYAPNERASVLKKVKFVKYQAGTLMSAKAVEEEIQRSVKRGWMESPGAYTPEVAGVAVPFPVNGRRAALTLCGPLFRVRPRIQEFGEMIRKTAKDYLAG